MRDHADGTPLKEWKDWLCNVFVDKKTPKQILDRLVSGGCAEVWYEMITCKAFPMPFGNAWKHCQEQAMVAHRDTTIDRAAIAEQNVKNWIF
jgi:hypothetical protein